MIWAEIILSYIFEKLNILISLAFGLELLLKLIKKILSQSSNLEPDWIIFDKLANYLRSEVFQRIIKLVKSLEKSARYNITRLSLGYKVKAKRRIRGYRASCTISSISGYILALWVIFGSIVLIILFSARYSSSWDIYRFECAISSYSDDS